MLEWIQSLIGIACWPIIAIFDWSMLEIYYYYCPVQIIALSITYFLRKKRILKTGLPLMHYILAILIGHIVYSVSFTWLFFWSLSNHGFW